MTHVSPLAPPTIERKKKDMSALRGNASEVIKAAERKPKTICVRVLKVAYELCEDLSKLERSKRKGAHTQVDQDQIGRICKEYITILDRLCPLQEGGGWDKWSEALRDQHELSHYGHTMRVLANELDIYTR